MFGSRKLRNSEWHILPDTGARYKWSEKRKKFVFENGDTVPAERVPRSASKQLDYTTDATHLPRQAASNSLDQNLNGKEGHPTRATAIDDSTVTKGRTLLNQDLSSSNAEIDISQTLSLRALNDNFDWNSAHGARQYIAEDPETKVKTKWQICSSRPSGDPGGSRRGVSKRIDETPGDVEVQFSEYKKMKRSDINTGTVFEILLVRSSQISNATTITAIPPNFQGSTRMCRFVIIQSEANENPPGFHALPVSTYEGRGVAKNGVVKAYHAIIHTSRQAPVSTQAEQPRRLPEGGAEAGMLPHAIRVEPRHPGYALDSMARLNFASIHSFDYGVKIKMFGKIHNQSLQDFAYQFRHVWQDRRQHVEQHHTAESMTSSSTPQSLTQAQPLGSSGARTPLTSQPLSQLPAGSSSTAFTHERNDSGVNFEGPVRVEQIINALNILRLRAQRENLPSPPYLDVSQQQRLAQDYQARVHFLTQISNIWNAIREGGARNQESNEDTEDDGGGVESEDTSDES